MQKLFHYKTDSVIIKPIPLFVCVSFSNVNVLPRLQGICKSMLNYALVVFIRVVVSQVQPFTRYYMSSWPTLHLHIIMNLSSLVLVLV